MFCQFFSFLFNYRISLRNPWVYQFQATDRPASRLSELLLPYLRIKRRQAELLVELQQTKQRAMLQPSHWFEREFPRWQEKWS